MADDEILRSGTTAPRCGATLEGRERPTRWLGVAAAIVAGVALFGCGSDDDSTSAESSTTTTTTIGGTEPPTTTTTVEATSPSTTAAEQPETTITPTTVEQPPPSTTTTTTVLTAAGGVGGTVTTTLPPAAGEAPIVPLAGFWDVQNTIEDPCIIGGTTTDRGTLEVLDGGQRLIGTGLAGDDVDIVFERVDVTPEFTVYVGMIEGGVLPWEFTFAFDSPEHFDARVDTPQGCFTAYGDFDPDQ